MTVVRALACVFSLVLATATFPALAASAAEPSPDVCYAIDIVLDGEAPADQRQLHLQRLRNAAGAGSGAANYLIGTFYRHGSRHPGSLFERDLDQAKRHLGKSAISGYLPAMAALAEIELERGNGMDAMIWIQARIHYNETAASDPSASAYQADVLLRAYKSLGPGGSKRQKQDIEEFLAGFIAKYGAGIEAGIAGEHRHFDHCPPSYDSMRWPLRVVGGAPSKIIMTRTMRGLEHPGYGLYLISVQPDGSVGRVLVQDGFPDLQVARALLPRVRALRFNAAEGAPPRTAFLPMSFDDDSVKLRD